MALENEYVFHSDDLPRRIFSFWENKRTEFCDISFRVGGRSFSAHRIILAAAMPFLYKLFSEKETADSGKKEIEIPNVDSDAFESLIEYAYKCKVKISVDNVKKLLSGACVLQVNEVRNACYQFLYDRLNTENVFDVLSLSSSLDCKKLTEKIDSFIINNFSEIIKTEEFLNVPFSLLKKWICSDELNVQNEEVIFEGALKWVKRCPMERKENLLELLKNIRFPLLDVRYIKNYVAQEILIQSSHTCRDLIEEAIFYHLVPEERKKICSFDISPRRYLTNVQKTKVEETLNICILFEGKNYVVRSFDLTNQKWKIRRISGDPVCLSNHHAVVTLNKKMYCFLNDVTQILDLKTKRYSSCGGMKHPRTDTGSVAHENKVFICGGYEGEKASNIVECFNPQTEDFIQLRCMNTSRAIPGAAACREFIYVLGGLTWTRSATNFVEKYNMKTGMWSTSSPMLTERWGFGCCTLKDKIYVCGGASDETAMPIAEVFDVNANEWKFIALMNKPRLTCKLVSCCNELYALEDLYVETDVYNPETDQWRVGPVTKKSGIIACAAVLLPPV